MPDLTRSTPRNHRLCLPILLILAVCSLSGCRESSESPSKPSASTIPRRIISTAPSLTETLFELGLGDRVIGVTDYCNYPEAAKKRTKIGSLHDPNLEQILILEPDLVLVLAGEGNQIDDFKKLDLPIFTVDHRSIQGVIDSFKAIGTRCGVPEKGKELAHKLKDRIQRLRKKTAQRTHPRTMICIDRTLGTGRLEDLYVAGSNPFFNEAISAAGGKNVMADSPISFPMISPEGVLQTDPEVILDMSPTMLKMNKERHKAMDDWKMVDVAATRTGRLYLLDDDYALVPGPRFILLLEKLAELLHQEKETGPSPSTAKPR